MMDRLNTRNILRRKKQRLQGITIIVSSTTTTTTLRNLRFICSSAWQSLGISWDFTKELFQMMQHAKLQYQNPFFTKSLANLEAKK